jgi:predicted outer membrane repeat protein
LCKQLNKCVTHLSKYVTANDKIIINTSPPSVDADPSIRLEYDLRLKTIAKRIFQNVSEETKLPMDFTSSQLRRFITESNLQGAISNTKKLQSYLTPARNSNSSATESGGAISVTKSLQPFIAAAHSTNSSATNSGGTISETNSVQSYVAASISSIASVVGFSKKS